MKKNLFVPLLFLLFFGILSCNQPVKINEKTGVKTDSFVIATTQQPSTPASNAANNAPETIVIDCDSIYKNKGIFVKFTVITGSEQGEFTLEGSNRNTIFSVEQKSENRTNLIFKDTIQSDFQDITFEDYNNDGIKDMVIQNFDTRARANVSYHLFIFDGNKIKQIKGFEAICNPSYNTKHQIIESYSLHGENEISFYNIVKDTIFNYKISVIEDKNFNKKYKKAIDKIKKM